MKQDIYLMRRLALILMIMFTLTFVSPIFISATSLDELQQQSQQEEQSGLTTTETIIYEENVVEEQSGSTGALADYMRGYTPITEENMQFAATTMSPFVNLMGNVAGCIMVFTTAFLFVVTALDLCYIAIPVVRPFLNPQSNVSAGTGMPMTGGYGGYGGMRGMGGMGMAGGAQQPQEYGLRRKWISDEADAVVNQFAHPQQGGMNNMGMGQGGMMYGGMGMMGGMGGMQQPQQPVTPVKIVIFEYFKKRVLFLIIFAIASTLLMSSLFTDCGLNIAELGVKVMNKLNGKITEINI